MTELDFPAWESVKLIPSAQKEGSAEHIAIRKHEGATGWQLQLLVDSSIPSKKS